MTKTEFETLSTFRVPSIIAMLVITGFSVAVGIEVYRLLVLSNVFSEHPMLMVIFAFTGEWMGFIIAHTFWKKGVFFRFQDYESYSTFGWRWFKFYVKLLRWTIVILIMVYLYFYADFKDGVFPGAFILAFMIIAAAYENETRFYPFKQLEEISSEKLMDYIRRVMERDAEFRNFLWDRTKNTKKVKWDAEFREQVDKKRTQTEEERENQSLQYEINWFNYLTEILVKLQTYPISDEIREEIENALIKHKDLNLPNSGQGNMEGGDSAVKA